MALTLTAGMGHNQPPADAGPVRLPDSMHDVLRSYSEAHTRASQLASEAEAAKKVADAAKARIVSAMGTATAAVCREAMVTRADLKPADATITLKTGETVLLTDVRLIVLAGNRAIEGAEVGKVYGGRSGSVKLTVGGKL